MIKRKKNSSFVVINISWKHGCVVCELQCFYTVDQLAADLFTKRCYIYLPLRASATQGNQTCSLGSTSINQDWQSGG